MSAKKNLVLFVFLLLNSIAYAGIPCTTNDTNGDGTISDFESQYCSLASDLSISTAIGAEYCVTDPNDEKYNPNAGNYCSGNQYVGHICVNQNAKEQASEYQLPYCEGDNPDLICGLNQETIDKWNVPSCNVVLGNAEEESNTILSQKTDESGTLSSDLSLNLPSVNYEVGGVPQANFTVKFVLSQEYSDFNTDLIVFAISDLIENSKVLTKTTQTATVNDSLTILKAPSIFMETNSTQVSHLWAEFEIFNNNINLWKVTSYGEN